MTKAEYASARRSRTLIRQAFLDELTRQELEGITVTDIVHRAGINRSTFYAHYSNVPGLLSEFEGEVLEKLRTVLRNAQFPAMFENPEPFLAMIADFIQADADLYRTLLKARGSEVFHAELEEVFTEHMRLAADVPKQLRDSPMFRIRTAYFAGGMRSLYIKWLLGKLPYTLDEVTYQIAQLIRLTSQGLTEQYRDLAPTSQ